MSCVQTDCNNCGHCSNSKEETCKNCGSLDVFSEWDEEGDHDK